MFRTARSNRRVITRTTAAVVAAASLTLAGCGAGQYAQSVNQQAAILGANAAVGDMSTLNVRLAPIAEQKYPAGSDARVLLYLSNDGLNPDTLTSVSSPAAKSVQITGDPVVPGQTLVDLSGDSGRRVTLTGLVQDLYYGVSIPMTFSFANAGSLTLNVPIQNPPERSTNRETLEILPPHPTALWEEKPANQAGGEAGGSAAAGGASAAPTNANQGGNVEGQGSSSTATTTSAPSAAVSTAPTSATSSTAVSSG